MWNLTETARDAILSAFFSLLQVHFPDVERVEWLNKVKNWAAVSWICLLEWSRPPCLFFISRMKMGCLSLLFPPGLWVLPQCVRCGTSDSQHAALFSAAWWNTLTPWTSPWQPPRCTFWSAHDHSLNWSRCWYKNLIRGTLVDLFEWLK